MPISYFLVAIEVKHVFREGKDSAFESALLILSSTVRMSLNVHRAAVCLVTEGENKLSFPRLWSQENVSKQHLTAIGFSLGVGSASQMTNTCSRAFHTISFTSAEHATYSTVRSDFSDCDSDFIKLCFLSCDISKLLAVNVSSEYFLFYYAGNLAAHSRFHQAAVGSSLRKV